MTNSTISSRLRYSTPSALVTRWVLLAIQFSFIASDIRVLGADGAAPPFPQRMPDSFRGPKPTKISLFVGCGDKTASGQQLTQELGVNAYSPNAVLTLEQFTDIAIGALKREGREVSGELPCSANIELSTGELTMLFRTKEESCFVSFDSSGRITRVGGAVGFHGEGGWHRDYKNGQPIGPSVGSPTHTNQPSILPEPNRR